MFDVRGDLPVEHIGDIGPEPRCIYPVKMGCLASRPPLPVRLSLDACATLKFRKDSAAMKAAIHPAYEEINVICACGSTFKTRSTHKGDIRVEICSSCHPFFTGRQKLVDTEGRVDRFQKKMAKSKDLKDKKELKDSKKQPVGVR